LPVHTCCGNARLELFDADGKRRLGHVADRSRTGEVTLARERAQVLEMADDHHDKTAAFEAPFLIRQRAASKVRRAGPRGNAQLSSWLEADQHSTLQNFRFAADSVEKGIAVAVAGCGSRRLATG
jgi:hypothetical protein